MKMSSFITNPFVKHLVADAGAFLKPTSLEKIGENVYTTRQVVEEIRDHATKQRLQVLPYELHYVEPTPECIKHVTEFSKKTGDFPSLSFTDLQLIAAVYQLEKEHGDVERLRKEPVITKTYGSTKNPSDGASKGIVGFFLPPVDRHDPENKGDLSKQLDALSLAPQSQSQGAERNNDETADQVDTVKEENESDQRSSSTEQDEPRSDDDEDEESELQDDDADGWITPNNIQKALIKFHGDDAAAEDETEKSISVACISADFAVQNVLLHMGLGLVSADGVLIKRLRTYVLRCFGCFKTTSVMTTRFCPNCGNATLKKVAVTVNPDTGTLEYHISKRKRISVRGTKFSLPSFKGGKHARNPVLVADQPTPHNRQSKKALQSLDVMDPDYLARDSPFLMKDVTSKSAVLGARMLQKGETRRNPNAWAHGRKRGGKKN